MKITLLTYGSRGDVQPFLALALGLQNAGHRVTLAAPQRFMELIRSYGIQGAPLPGDPEELSRLFNHAGGNLVRMVRAMQDHLFRIAPGVVRAARQAMHGADLLVHSFAFTTGAHSFAHELGIPDVSVQLFPVFAPTRAFAPVGMPEYRLGWLNRLSHQVYTQIFWRGGNAGYYRLRRSAPADFPARLYWPFRPNGSRPLTPLVFACSPVVLSNPPDWNLPHIHQVGYFFLDSPNYEPPGELRRFLQAGDPPVCLTFGSMINREAEGITRAALHALDAARRRVIVLPGWGGWRPDRPPENSLFLEAAPHDWLFPRCQMVIHHGGAGTTAAGLRAGVPSILVPHAADQPFWGRRVAAIGAAPPPIPLRRLTVQSLANALALADSQAIRRRAAQVGQLICAENGVVRAVALIEAHATAFHRSGAGQSG